ncbi:MAG: hypothetical protein ACJAWH_000915 [Maribacter sp.]|jgi:hypothetical protein
MTQGEEDFQFIKEEKDKTRNFILQKDKLTKIGFYVVVSVILISFIAFLITSADFF